MGKALTSFAVKRPMVTRLVFDRLVPASLFAAVALSSVGRLAQAWAAPAELAWHSQLMHTLDLLHLFLTLVFVGLLTALFLVRRAPVSDRAGASSMIIALGGTFVMLLAYAQPNTTADWRVFALSDLLMIAGLAFAAYAFGALRACFGIAPEARGLVTTGAYRWVRHPAYLGEFVVAFGGILPVLSPLAVLVFGLFCVLQARRATLEEAVLDATFPEYAGYKQRTPALFPWPPSV